jgi:hypothetical protein
VELNPLDDLKHLLKQYGKDLPPLEKRRPLWRLMIQSKNTSKARDILIYIESNAGNIHPTLLGEIGKLLYD